jgi:hypothetical protein
MSSVLRRLALMPLGGSKMSLLAHVTSVAGRFGLMSEVRKRRKSACTLVRVACSFLSSFLSQFEVRCTFLSNTQPPTRHPSHECMTGK